jgi:hypothetical protein
MVVAESDSGEPPFHTSLDNVCFLYPFDLHAEASRGIAMIIENQMGIQLAVRCELDPATGRNHRTRVNRKSIQNKRLAKCHFYGRMALLKKSED